MASLLNLIMTFDRVESEDRVDNMKVALPNRGAEATAPPKPSTETADDRNSTEAVERKNTSSDEHPDQADSKQPQEPVELSAQTEGISGMESPEGGSTEGNNHYNGLDLLVLSADRVLRANEESDECSKKENNVKKKPPDQVAEVTHHSEDRAATEVEMSKGESTNETDEDAEEHVNTQRKHAIEALRESSDLVTMSAALRVVKELHRDVSLDKESQVIVDKASIAVPYLMYKSVIENLTLPRSTGGPAYAEARAKEIAASLFETMGPNCCSPETSVQKLMKEGGLKRSDASKVLPQVLRVGKSTRELVEEVRTRIVKASRES